MVEQVRHVEVYFKDIKAQLIEKIRKAQYIVGAVAWVTDKDILTELAAKRGVQLIIQNDTMATRQNKYDGFREILRAAYRRLPRFDWAAWERLYWPSLKEPPTAPKPSQICAGDACAVRICGQPQSKTARQNRDDQQVSMMHDKILMFFDEKGICTGVSTGSYNMSKNASLSYENVMYIEDERVSRLFFDEVLDILRNSVPLRI